MLECFSFETDGESELVVYLPFEARQKSRYRTETKSGKPLSWFIERGHVLADGNILIAQTGERIRVESAPETLSVVTCDDRFQLMRAAYHLGNRHVPLQVEPDRLCYQHDHVLDDMVIGLGLSVSVESLPFHPESGAYSGGGHSHGHHH